MSLSFQCSIVEQFSFNEKKGSVSACQGGRVPCVKRCLHGNWIQGGKKAIQNLVPRKYKLRFGDEKPSLSQGEDIFPLHKVTALLKEPAIYCFLLGCEKAKAESFMEWLWKQFYHWKLENYPQPSKKKTIKYKPLSLEMRSINIKF